MESKSSTSESSPDQGRHAVVAVIIEQSRFLVIRRSEFVRAPGLLCFPGGGIEANESFESAIQREMLEELGLAIQVTGHLWTSVTRWGTKLEWLACERSPLSMPVPAPAEVSEVLWMEEPHLRHRADLLGSIPDFFAAKDAGEFSLD
jgi:8-oxo-dGTP diphosphatase